MDLLYGFGPLVRTLSKQDKEQALGFTFSLEGQMDNDDWLNQFADRYTAMVERLTDRLPDVLANTRDAEERAAAPASAMRWGQHLPPRLPLLPRLRHLRAHRLRLRALHPLHP